MMMIAAPDGGKARRTPGRFDRGAGPVDGSTNGGRIVHYEQEVELGMSNFLQITPFMHVPDLGAAVAFFEEVLGFQTLLRMTDYAYLQRETVGMRLLESHGPKGAPPGNRRFAYYVDVRDVDALHAELRPRLDELPKGDVHGPADKEYGQRELAIVAPDGNLIVFGQAMRAE